MLNEYEFYEYCNVTHKLSKEAIQYINYIRNNPPSRMVGVNATSNVISHVPSKKMRHTISTESRGPEWCFKLFNENDDRCLEIWDQIEPIDVYRTGKNGQKRRGSYTADFLVLTTRGPRVIEVKPHETLLKLVGEKPKDWIQRSEDTFIYKPAQDAFNLIGIEHEVFAFKTSMQVKAFNLDLLSHHDDLNIDLLDIQNAVDRAFERQFAYTMNELRIALKLENYNSILKLIRDGYLVADLDSELLSEPDSTKLFRDILHIEALKELQTHKVSQSNGFVPVECTTLPNSTEVNKVLNRLERIQSGEKNRSTRRWKQQIREGKTKGLTPFQSLISRHYLSGNRKRKLHTTVVEFLTQYIQNEFAPKQGLSFYWGHKQYWQAALEAHPSFSPVSRQTFTKAIKSLPKNFISGIRRGRRGKNADSQSTNPHSRNLRAQLPWERASIDHYLADVFLIVGSHDGVVYAERPWLTAMIDISTGRVLAITLSFKPPSKSSCCKVIRECVRNHSKLPREIIVDRGSDFRSTYFAALCAHYEITLSFRPASFPRYGGEIEGLFGDFKTSWLSQRPGNLANFKDARESDGTHIPKRYAILRAYDLYSELHQFCSFRDAKPSNIDNCSRHDAFNRRHSEFPRVAVHVIPDDEFYLFTAVDERKYVLDTKRGVKINELWYFSSDISDSNLKKSQIEIRIDPENPHVVYGFINNRWCALYSANISTYSTLPKEHQFEKGLIGIEGAQFRRKLREAADLDIAKLIRELNSCYDADCLAEPLADEGSSILPPEQEVLDLELVELSTESWS
ncbi:DDE-type integrase/transposase/recombinase [Aestuariibacter salexigens]|uniref:DDE-type integrase/transposase/recombinase n=1 Tax=Aestuariibacter salexigens TaxID=226010 RepID=UPI00041179F1|nr:DDE-type integrase/transposase/recombinase [Aestuariibacter salexigens]